jgi:hypothetical protein
MQVLARYLRLLSSLLTTDKALCLGPAALNLLTVNFAFAEMDAIGTNGRR